jgi:hypothetical protein
MLIVFLSYKSLLVLKNPISSKTGKVVNTYKGPNPNDFKIAFQRLIMNKKKLWIRRVLITLSL